MDQKPTTPFGEPVIPVIGKIHGDGDVTLARPWPKAPTPTIEERWRTMYASAEESAAQKRARHQRWIAELSDHDWVRIRALAREVREDFVPARLEDLDAKGLAVGVCAAGVERWCSGERIGALLDGKVAVLVWEKN